MERIKPSFTSKYKTVCFNSIFLNAPHSPPVQLTNQENVSPKKKKKRLLVYVKKCEKVSAAECRKTTKCNILQC